MASIDHRVKMGDGERSDKRNRDSVEYVIILAPGDDKADAWAALVTEANAEVALGNVDYPLSNVALEATDSESIYYGKATYEDSDRKDEEGKEPKEEFESAFSFDTTGGEQKITHSNQTMFVYHPDPLFPTAPDYRGGINVSKTSVDGVEITIPKYSFSVTKIWPDSFLTPPDPPGVNYLDLIRDYTGYINDASVTLTTYRGLAQTFAAGEVRFDGVKGKPKSKTTWEFIYHFTFSKGLTPSDTPISIGDISVTEKRGWDYLWVAYEEKVDPVAHVLVRTPMGVYIEAVYKEMDFDLLLLNYTGP